MAVSAGRLQYLVVSILSCSKCKSLAILLETTIDQQRLVLTSLCWSIVVSRSMCKSLAVAAGL